MVLSSQPQPRDIHDQMRLLRMREVLRYAVAVLNFHAVATRLRLLDLYEFL